MAGFALTLEAHPSPFVDPKTKQYEKFLIAVGVNRKIAEEALSSAVNYAEIIEKLIGNDPNLTAPWLYGDTKRRDQNTEEGKS